MFFKLFGKGIPHRTFSLSHIICSHILYLTLEMPELHKLGSSFLNMLMFLFLSAVTQIK